jgi:predicted alpha/beta hydrolase family esterase
MMEFLVMPGYGGSGPKHWQTHWEKMDPIFRRVEQKDWEHPVCAEWTAALEAAVAASGKDVILVAHSLACLLVAHWASAAPRASLGKIRGAFLVAVPDPGGPAFPQAAKGFAPVPQKQLPFASFIVASTDDPYADVEFARGCARAWGGGLTVIGAKGHINAESGLGAWAEGRRLLDAFCAM